MARVDFDSALGDTYMRMYTVMKRKAPQNIRTREAVNKLEREDAFTVRVRAERMFTGYTADQNEPDELYCTVCGELLGESPKKLIRQVWYNAGGRTDFYKHEWC